MLPSAPLTSEPTSIEAPHQGDPIPIAQQQVALIDEGRWAEQIRQQQCMQDSELKLKSRVEDFLARATPEEQSELDEARHQLWALMKDAKAKDDVKNPDPDGVQIPTSQRFKRRYATFLKSGYELSKHLDLFVDQAPEYVSLAWGAIKILMVVQISNEELKQSVHSHLKLLVRKFDLVDHLPELMPQQNLITAIAEAYGLFSKFLAKAIKYYSECRALRYLKAFTSPWKIRFQDLVNEIDVAFRYIKEITQARSLIAGEMNLAATMQIQQFDKKMWNVIKHLPEQLQKLEDKLKTINFENSADVSQTTSMVQQRLEERFAEPAKLTEEKTPEHKEADSDILDIFTDLRDLELNLGQRRSEAEDISATNEQKTKKRNMFQSDDVLAWIEAEESQLLWVDGNYILSRTNFLTSFATPLTIDAACNYESILILKCFCGDVARLQSSCCVLMQSLIAQVLTQRPHLLAIEGAGISRLTLAQAARDLRKLWDIFSEFLLDGTHSKVDRTYIIIDSVDELSSGQADDYGFLMSRINDLITSGNQIIKILLTAHIMTEAVVASDISNALSVRQRKWSLVPFQDEFPSLQQKFSEIQEGRCKSIKFPELMLLYPPNTVIFTKEDDEFRAYVVLELSGMTETMPGRFDPLHLRVWSIDHNGTYFTKRHTDLTISQFSGAKAVRDLRYVPASHLPEEARVRIRLMARGQWYWELASEPHHCVYHGRDSVHVMVDEASGPRQRDISAQEIEDQFPAIAASALKPLTKILCPPIISAYNLSALKWGKYKYKVEKLQRVTRSESPLRYLSWSNDFKEMVHANVAAYLKQNSSELGDLVQSKKQGLFMLFHGPSDSGKSLTIETIAAEFGLPLLVIDASHLSRNVDIEYQFQQYLELGLRWTALIHFIRADEIFSEADNSSQGLGNITRIAYRELQSYKGIVALSTETVGHLPSKISTMMRLIFSFKTVTETQRVKIWESLLKERNFHDKDMILEYVEEQLKESSAAPTGLEARNILENANAMAEADERRPDWKDFKKAVNLALVFKKHIEGNLR